MQVLRLPAEADSALGRERREPVLVFDPARPEVPCLRHIHPAWREVEHQRGLDEAAVDAVTRLRRPHHSLWIAQPAPGAGDGEHPGSRPQPPAHDVHDLGLAAVAVQQHELAHPGARHALADFGPERHQRLGTGGQRAGEADVLDREADRLGRQHEHGQRVRQQRQGAGDHPLVDDAVHRDGQMRPMLLDGCDRQHGNRVRGQVREGGPGQVLPAPGREHVGVLSRGWVRESGGGRGPGQWTVCPRGAVHLDEPSGGRRHAPGPSLSGKSGRRAACLTREHPSRRRINWRARSGRPVLARRLL